MLTAKYIGELDTPVAIIDLDRMEANIEQMAQLAKSGGKRLRPHVKTHKCVEIARRQLEAGAVGLTVAKVDEAVVMVDGGFDDIFIANSVATPEKVKRLIGLHRRARISVGVDSIACAEIVNGVAVAEGERLNVRMEIDTGGHRAGVQSLEEATSLARFLVEARGLRLTGIFTHEGHTYGATNREACRETVDLAAEAMRSYVSAFEEVGIPIDEVSMGSTPGAEFLASQAGITEMRPGNYLFLDRMQVGMGADPARCALTLLATVISIRPDGRLLLDAGVKALASDRPFADGTFGSIVGHPELVFFGANEEHGNVRIVGSTELRVGDQVRIVPNHACTCVNMHDYLIACQGDRVVESWAVAARGRFR